MTADTPNQTLSVDEAVAREFAECAHYLPALFELLDAGVPVPFLARYRRDRVGGLSEARIREIRDRRVELSKVEERRAAIEADLLAREALTDDIRAALSKAKSLAALEDVYRPLREETQPESRELEEKFGALASAMLEGGSGLTLGDLAAPFVSEERGIPDAEAAVAGAVRVLARRFASDPQTRSRLTRLCLEKGKVHSEVVPGGDTGKKYQTYHDFTQPVKSVPSHRVLAILRGAKESALSVDLLVERDEALAILREQISVPDDHPAKAEVDKAIELAFDEVLKPELTREVLESVKAKADEDSVKIFARNLEQLLLMPPAGAKVVMGVEPGVRRGCKIAVVGADGAYLAHASVYPFPPRGKEEAAKKTVGDFCRHHKVELIGIGSGPGCREVERFFRGLIREDEGLAPEVALVNEAGVAAWATSENAKTEFPKLDPRVRSAVTIARRLQDPLSELVKLEPRAIGVGPYQRDVDQERLDTALDDVVMSCVAKVGVDVNRADAQVLRYVPGVGKDKAEALAKWRAENGPIKSRVQLREVPGFDESAWRFASGFLRVADGENPLDRTGIHPENYELVESMAGKLGVEPVELLGNERALGGLDPAGFAGEDRGIEVVNAVFDELRRPEADPRGTFETPTFREDLKSIEDLKAGMTLEGLVTNIASFGAFVDVGVDQEGLIHVSELSDGFVADPGAVVSVGQKVQVRVLGVDQDRKRLSLSMRTPGAKKAPRRGGGGGGGGGRRGGPRSKPEGQAGAAGQRGGPGRGGPGRGGPGRGGGRGRGGPGAGGGRGGGRGGGGRGGGRRRDDRRGSEPDDRAPRVIEQRAKREPEPEIDPNLPEAEKFRLKLERLRKKFEKGS